MQSWRSFATMNFKFRTEIVCHLGWHYWVNSFENFPRASLYLESTRWSRDVWIFSGMRSLLILGSPEIQSVCLLAMRSGSAEHATYLKYQFLIIQCSGRPFLFELEIWLHENLFAVPRISCALDSGSTNAIPKISRVLDLGCIELWMVGWINVHQGVFFCLI